MQNYKYLECKIFRMFLKPVSDHLSALFQFGWLYLQRVAYFRKKNKNKKQTNKTKKEKKIYHSCLTEFNTKHFSGRAKQKQFIWIKSKSEWNFTLNVNDTIADRIYISEVNSIGEEKLMKKEHPVKNYISFLFRKFSKKS